MLVENYGDNFSDEVTFKYNTDNQLTEIYFDPGERPERYVFEYTDGIISKKSFTLAPLSNMTLNLWKYYTYEVTNGNITKKKEYNSVNDLVSETTFTYTSDPNVFKPLALLNFRNNLGLIEVANDETFFNNLLSLW